MTAFSLIDGNVYRLPSGREFLVHIDGRRCELFNHAEWLEHIDAAYVVEADGTISFQGLDTGWRADDLTDTGRNSATWH